MIEAHIQTLTATVDVPVSALPHARVTAKPRQNEPRFEIRTPLHQLTGTDLTQIDGIGPYTALKLVSEIGTDMRRWPSEKHFTSWLTLAPNNKISGGRLLSSQTPPSANRAAAILRMAAMSLGRTNTALGAFYRRLAVRVGKAKAITATARKLAVLVYRTLKGEMVYCDAGATAYDAQQQQRVLRRLRQRAATLGFDSSIARRARYSRQQFLRSQGFRVRVAAGAPIPKEFADFNRKKIDGEHKSKRVISLASLRQNSPSSRPPIPPAIPSFSRFRPHGSDAENSS